MFAAGVVAEPLICGNCGATSRVLDTPYGRKDQCPGCNWYSWGGKDMASPTVIRARRVCHDMFDPVWQRDHLSRGEAYRRLAGLLEMTPEACHFGLMSDLPTLRRAYVAARAVRQLAERPPVKLTEPLDQFLVEAS